MNEMETGKRIENGIVSHHHGSSTESHQLPLAIQPIRRIDVSLFTQHTKHFSVEPQLAALKQARKRNQKKSSSMIAKKSNVSTSNYIPKGGRLFQRLSLLKTQNNAINHSHVKPFQFSQALDQHNSQLTSPTLIDQEFSQTHECLDRKHAQPSQESQVVGSEIPLSNSQLANDNSQLPEISQSFAGIHALLKASQEAFQHEPTSDKTQEIQE